MRAKFWAFLLALFALAFGGEVDELLSSAPDPVSDPSGYRLWKYEYGRATGAISDAEFHRLVALDALVVERVENGYVAADVDLDGDDGSFEEGGAPAGDSSYVKLTFGWPSDGWTEWVMFYVDGNWAKTDHDHTIEPADTHWVSGETTFVVWESWHGVYIREEITPVSLGSTPGVSEHIKFKAVMKPADGDCHDVGCIVYYDTMLDWNDAAPIATAFGYTGVAEIFFDTTDVGIPPIWHAYENSFPPAPGDIVATGILTGYDAYDNPPNVFWYGYWPYSVGNGWDDSDWIADTGSPFTDSSTMVKWYPQHVCPGDSVVFVTYYGIGVVDLGVTIEHTPPEFEPVCGNLSPNPAEIDAIITNGNTMSLTDVTVFLDLGECDLIYAGGDPNPESFASIGGFGGTQAVHWLVYAPPEAFGTTQCYNIIEISNEDTTIEHYCVDLPAALPMAELGSAWFSEETDCDGANAVEICYDITTCDDAFVPVGVEISTDDGASWFVPTELYDTTGAIGANVTTGTHCFTWLASEELPDVELDNLRVKIEYLGTDTLVTYEHVVAETVGVLDTRPPEVVAFCPGETLFLGDTVVFGWELSDFAPHSAEPCSVVVNYCIGADTFVVADSLVWTPPAGVLCDSAELLVVAPDSFCNWGVANCYFHVVTVGGISLSFPTVTAPGCDTADVEIAIDSSFAPVTSGFTLYLDLNTDIAEPVGFVPGVSPAPDSVALLYDGAWKLYLGWDDRVVLSGDRLGILKLFINCNAVGGDFTPIDIDSFESDLIQINWTDGVVIVDYTPDPWLLEVRFDDMCGGGEGLVALGNAYGALDGYDGVYDLLYLPPSPGDLDVYIELADSLYPSISRLRRSICDMEPLNEWRIVVGGSEVGCSVYVHWDVGDLGEGEYLLNGYQDMRVDSDYVAYVGETLEVVWYLPELGVYRFGVSRGWNLLSLCVLNPGGRGEVLFGGSYAGPFGYDCERGSYYYAERVRVGEGYWVFYLGAGDLLEVGVPVYSYERDVCSGWVLLGSVMDSLVISDIDLPFGVELLGLWGWDSESGVYYMTEELLPCRGYWGLFTGGGRIKVGSE